MWERRRLQAEDKSADELEGLRVLISLWIMRDIEFIHLNESIHDAKKTPSEKRKQARLAALQELTAALTWTAANDDWDDFDASASLFDLDPECCALDRAAPRGLRQNAGWWRSR